MYQQRRQLTPGEVVAYFIIALFALGLLIYTAIGNLALLQRVYPDPQFVGFGLLALDGGIVVWTVLSFLTRKDSSHFGICLVGLGVDTLLSFTSFMYELAFKTGSSLPVSVPVIYVIGFSVIFNVGAGLCYKLIPKQHEGNLIPAQFPAQFPAGNLIPAPKQDVSPDELQMVANRAITAYLESRGVTAAPLSLRAPQPQEQETGPGLVERASAALSTVSRNVRDSMKRGRRAAPVPGSQNETTNASMPASSTETEQLETEMESEG